MIKNTVEKVLQRSPDARADDKVLILQVFEDLGLTLTPAQQKVFHDLPSTESIRRIRQKFQENGQYKAPERVTKFRQHKSHVVQQNAPTATPQHLGDLLDNTYLKQTKLDTFTNVH